jgi:hypothetical protein
MIKKILLFLSLFGISCTSDDILRSEKTSFYNIYKDIIIRDTSSTEKLGKNQKKIYDRAWLSKFNQPIIVLSSSDGKTGATLVALGNYQNRLTWVSADGISVSFLNGILIATRGYSQDLMESKHSNIDSFMTHPAKSRSKTYRYLNGENEYIELNFSCFVAIERNNTSSFLDLTLKTTKFSENCKSGSFRHTNEYYVLPNTNIVLKSKQWISEANGYIFIHNYYAFQNNLL